MHYSNMVPGIFHARPNRFIAHVEIDGEIQVCHVKNTGRCRELLPPGAKVWCQESNNPNRKTKYDLIAVQKGDRLINMDSQAPNIAAGEWLRSGGLGPIEQVKAETVHGDSRFDFSFVKDGTLFLLYGRNDFEKMTNRRYEYIKGLNGHSEIALYVDTFEEVDEAYKKAVENGATSVLEPELEPWGQRTCYIADPEGNLIEIGSWNKPYEEKDLEGV